MGFWPPQDPVYATRHETIPCKEDLKSRHAVAPVGTSYLEIGIATCRAQHPVRPLISTPPQPSIEVRIVTLILWELAIREVGLILMSCVLEPSCVRIPRAVSVSVGCAVWETPGAFLASHREVDHEHCDFYLRTYIFWGTSCHPSNMV